MLKKSLFIASLVSVVLTGCQWDGQDGQPGATGAQGAAGTPGANGANAPIGMQLTPIARYVTGTYGAGAAEIAQYDAARKQLYVVNGAANKVEILDLASLKNQALNDPITANNLIANSLPVPSQVAVQAPDGSTQTLALGFANSLSIKGNWLAVAVEGKVKTDAGAILFYQLGQGAPVFKHAVQVGALPDMVTFNQAGTLVLVANEGEPAPDYKVDPAGSISLIAVKNDVPQLSATTLDFKGYDNQQAALAAKGVKFAAPAGTLVSQDLEPEYITVSADDKTAWVSLQENNALARIDLTTQKIDALQPLGSKDHNLERNTLDVSNKDGVLLQKVPGLRGLYQPDTIASYQWQGSSFVVTANEGDARDWPGYSEQKRVAAVTRNTDLVAAQSAMYNKDGLGRLNVTTAVGQDSNGQQATLFAFGARSFSIWDKNGQQVFDSGNDFERIAASVHGSKFNSNHLVMEGDNRSDDKGPEPEALALGTIGNRTYAFIGAERMSSIYIYDITNPFAASFVDYSINRNLDAVYTINDETTPVTVTGDIQQAGDLGPESLVFIQATQSPIAVPLLVSANEVSGSVTVYTVQEKR